MYINKINKIFKQLLIVMALLSVSLCLVSAQDMVVVIDAGHGGKDPGAHGSCGNEKDVTLGVALKLGSQISKLSGVKVVYTRTSDVFIPLATRAQIANNAHADLFISVHCNSNSKSSAYGTETWVLGSEENRAQDNMSVVQRENSVIYLEEDYEKTYNGFNPNSPEDIIAMTLLQSVHYDNSISLAQLVQNEFVRDNRKNRGVKQSGFAVLWRTAMPSVLVEIGFLSNPTEGSYLCSYNGQQEVANSLYSAFLSYKKVWDKKNKHEIVKPKPKVEKPIEGGEYKIQILASPNLFPVNDNKFRGLKDIVVIKNEGNYKYYYGVTKLESEKSKIVEEVKKKGFKTAFPVLFEYNKGTYLIEIFSSDKKYNVKNKVFGSIESQRIKNSSGERKYTYYTMNKKTYNEALKELEKIKKQGFSKAILVKISDK